MPTRLFSYVVDHDYGFAPNPEGGLCTLVYCKFRHANSGRNNLVEMAKVGDWILGAGGTSRFSAGRGRILYLMRVDEKIPFEHYLSASEYRNRCDCHDRGLGNQFALLSKHFYYFGRNAVDVNQLPSGISRDTLLKSGMGYRRDIPAPQIKLLVDWFRKNYRFGVHGQPCAAGGNRALGRSERDRYTCKPRRRCSEIREVVEKPACITLKKRGPAGRLRSRC